MSGAGAPAPLAPRRVTWSARAALLAVAALLGWPGRGEAREATVLMLAGNGLSAADRRLIDAFRIYTSDIGCRLVLSAEAPPDADSGALSRIERLAQAEKADIVVWTSRRSDGGLAFYLLTTRDRDVRATDIAALGTNRAADSVALKIRSLLSSSAAAPPPGAASSSAAGSAPPTASAPPSGTAPPDEPPSPKPESAGAGAPSAPAAPPESAAGNVDRPRAVEAPASSARVSAAENPAREIPWAVLRVGYDVGAPVDGTWVRQGLMLSAEARLGATAFVAHVDGVLTRSSALEAGAVTGHLRDTPLGLAVARRWSGTRLSLAAGPRVGLHVIDVTAAGGMDVMGVRGGTRQISGGLGGWASIELRLLGPLSLWLGASAEALLPGRRFTLLGTAIAHTSPVLLATTAGLGIAIP